MLALLFQLLMVRLCREEAKRVSRERAHLCRLSQCLPPALLLQYPLSFPRVLGLLQQQAALAVVPAHSCSSQGPSCHTRAESRVKSRLFPLLFARLVPTWNPFLSMRLVQHDSVVPGALYLSQISGIIIWLLDPFLPYEAWTSLHSVVWRSRQQKRPVLANPSRLQHPCTVQFFTSAHIQGLILQPERLIYIPQQEGRLMTCGILPLLFLLYITVSVCISLT